MDARKVVMAFLCGLLALILAWNADSGAAIPADKFYVTNGLPQTKATTVEWTTSSKSRKHIMSRELQKIACDSQTCQTDNDCVDLDENCVCDLEEGKCYLEEPCESISCPNGNECTSSVNQLCNCNEVTKVCYDELLPPDDD